MHEPEVEVGDAQVMQGLGDCFFNQARVMTGEISLEELVQ